VSFVILFNGIFIGVQTEYQCQNLTDRVPDWFLVLEHIFCLFFVVEIVIRVWNHKLNFFIMPGSWRWNTFDLFLVVMQLVEVVMMHSTNGSGGQSLNISFVRLLRILRLLRVLRLVRLVQFVQEFNAIISSVANSVRSLLWTMLLMFMMTYMVGICLAQVVSSYRMESSFDLSDNDHVELDYWFGSLLRSVLTLYEAVMGGVDWDALVTPLMRKISVLMAPGFAFYIAFTMLAMMNVITGIFVQTALKNADAEKDADFAASARDIFSDVKEGGFVSADEFGDHVDSDRFQSYIATVGIAPKDAKLMFRILDQNNSGTLLLEELLEGMLRLRMTAKFMDVSLIMHETERQRRIWAEWSSATDSRLLHISDRLKRMEAAGYSEDLLTPGLHQVPFSGRGQVKVEEM